MVIRVRAFLLLAVALLAGCASEPVLEGSYIIAEDDSVAMVRLTGVTDGRVNGEISMVGSDDDGKTVAITRPISGTVDGKSLNLSIENFPGMSFATAMIDGENLRLTLFYAGTSEELILAKSDPEKFNQLVATARLGAEDKRRETEEIAARKDRASRRSKTQKDIDELADSVFSKAEEVVEKSRKIEVVIAGYRASRERTGRMQNAKRGIDARSDEGSYRISEIDYEIGNIASDMQHTHREVHNYMQSLSEFMTQNSAKWSRFSIECQADQLLDCSRLSGSVQSLQTRYQQFQRNYARENAAFNGRAGNST